MLRWEKLSLGYTDSQGTPILREEICRLYTTVSAEDIMVAAPQELIAMALRAMLKPGDHVVAIRPAYQSLYELAQSAGCKVSFWDPEVEHSGSFSFDVSSSHAAWWKPAARNCCDLQFHQSGMPDRT